MTDDIHERGFGRGFTVRGPSGRERYEPTLCGSLVPAVTTSAAFGLKATCTVCIALRAEHVVPRTPEELRAWMDRKPPPPALFERAESDMRSRAAPWFRDPRWADVDRRVVELVLELKLASPAPPHLVMLYMTPVDEMPLALWSRDLVVVWAPPPIDPLL